MRNLKVKLVVALALLTVCALAPARAMDKKNKKPAYGSIRITSNTPDAVIRINGVERARTGAQPVLIDLVPGTYDVEVEFSSTKTFRQPVVVEAGRFSCLCLNYVRRTVQLPCPYDVTVSAPASVNDGDLITFVGDLGYTGPGLISYAWSVSPSSAKIVRGAGTNTITVDSTGLGGQTVTATLVTDDGSGDVRCRQMAQVPVPIIPPPPPERPRRFDIFPNLAFDDSKARLDLYVVELQNAPNATGYVFIYGGKTSRPGQVDRLVERTRSYLTARGLSAARFVIANGGYRDVEQYELWVVPQGAELPQPVPSVSPSEVRPPAPRTRRATTPKAGAKVKKPVLKKRSRAGGGSDEEEE